jgi:predicted deacylase
VRPQYRQRATRPGFAMYRRSALVAAIALAAEGRRPTRDLAGTPIIAPLLNIPSFLSMSPHIKPVDRRGTNAAYPGDQNGTQTARALAAVEKEILMPADVVVDLHGGDLDEDGSRIADTQSISRRRARARASGSLYRTGGPLLHPRVYL